MIKPHVLAYYEDGRVQVAYCRKCSAEGGKLLEDCPQKIVTPKCDNPLDEKDKPAK